MGRRGARGAPSAREAPSQKDATSDSGADHTVANHDTEQLSVSGPRVDEQDPERASVEGESVSRDLELYGVKASELSDIESDAAEAADACVVRAQSQARPKALAGPNAGVHFDERQIREHNLKLWRHIAEERHRVGNCKAIVEEERSIWQRKALNLRLREAEESTNGIALEPDVETLARLQEAKEQRAKLLANLRGTEAEVQQVVRQKLETQQREQAKSALLQRKCTEIEHQRSQMISECSRRAGPELFMQSIPRFDPETLKWVIYSVDAELTRRCANGGPSI